MFFFFYDWAKLECTKLNEKGYLIILISAVFLLTNLSAFTSVKDDISKYFPFSKATRK